jgi:hypothetical protein
VAAQGDNLEGAREVAAMQFAGGMSIARLAEDWERDAAWVEESIRMALLDSIPRRSGGRKLPRTELRKARRLQIVGSDMEQPTLEW